MDHKYYELLDAYKASSYSEVLKIVTGYRYILHILTFSLISIGLILFILNPEAKYYYSLLFICSIIFSVVLIFLFEKQEKYFTKIYPSKKSFIKNNLLFHSAYRALIFFEKIHALDLGQEDIKKIKERIELENNLKKFNIWEIPVVIGTFIILGMVFEWSLNFIPKEYGLIVITTTIIIAIVTYFLFDTIRPKYAKTNELKLFLYWYEEFGQTLIKDNSKSKEKT